jgi:hypothetical protein
MHQPQSQAPMQTRRSLGAHRPPSHMQRTPMHFAAESDGSLSALPHRAVVFSSPPFLLAALTLLCCSKKCYINYGLDYYEFKYKEIALLYLLNHTQNTYKIQKNMYNHFNE